MGFTQKQLILITSSLLFALILTASFFFTQTQGSVREVSLRALANVTLNDEQLRWLQSQAHKEEVDLELLTEREKEEHARVAATLKELLERRDALTAEAAALAANQTALESEVAELRDMKDAIKGLLVERATLLADKKQLDDDQAELARARVQLAASRDSFKQDVARLAEDQRLMEHKLEVLRAEHRDAKQLSKDLRNSGYFRHVQDVGSLSSGSGADTSVDDLGERLGANLDKLPTDLSSTERRELGQLATVGRDTGRLNATVARILTEKESLKARLVRAVAALREIADAKEVECAMVADRALIRAPFDASSARKEWKHECRSLPYTQLTADYHCDQVWRRMLAQAAITSVDRVVEGSIHVSLVTNEGALYETSSTWLAEVAAFHLDRALQVYRTPAVVSRSVQRHSLVAAASSPELADAVAAAHTSSHWSGAMIGWASGSHISALVSPLAVYLDKWFDHLASTADASAIHLELTTYLLWSFITDDFSRTRRNYAMHPDEVFEAKGGSELVYLQNEGHWSSTKDYAAVLAAPEPAVSTVCTRNSSAIACKGLAALNETALAVEYVALLGTVCIFPEQVATQVLLFNATTLSDSLLEEPLDVHPSSLAGFEQRLAYTKRLISRCIDSHGQDEVLLHHKRF